MQFANLLSFNGRTGRLQVWLTMILTGVVQVATTYIPVTSHHVVLSNYGGFGEAYINYATPTEPALVQSWMFVSVFYLIATAASWIVLATLVKRLHDLGRSGKWAAVIVCALVVHLSLEAIFSSPNAPISIFEIANLIFIAPFCLVGAWGMFEIMIVRGKEVGGQV